MDVVELPDGTVQRNGRQDELEASGFYPPALGRALVQAWARSAATTSNDNDAVVQWSDGPVVQLAATTTASSFDDPWASDDHGQDQPTSGFPTTAGGGEAERKEEVNPWGGAGRPSPTSSRRSKVLGSGPTDDPWELDPPAASKSRGSKRARQRPPAGGKKKIVLPSPTDADPWA